MLGVDIQNQLAILLIPVTSAVRDEEMIYVRKWFVDLKVVDESFALGGVQEEDVKIKLPRPPPKRVS